jgi:hypothetical protein
MDEKIEKTSQPLTCVAGCGNKTCYRLNGMALCLPCMIFPTLETKAMIEASFSIRSITPAGDVQTFNQET